MRAVNRMAYSPKETARLLGLSLKTVQRHLANSVIRSVRLGRHRLIPATELDAILHSAGFGLE